MNNGRKKAIIAASIAGIIFINTPSIRFFLIVCVFIGIIQIVHETDKSKPIWFILYLAAAFPMLNKLGGASAWAKYVIILILGPIISVYIPVKVLQVLDGFRKGSGTLDSFDGMRTIYVPVVDAWNEIDEITGQWKTNIICETVDDEGNVRRFEFDGLSNKEYVSGQDYVMIEVSKGNWEKYRLISEDI